MAIVKQWKLARLSGLGFYQANYSTVAEDSLEAKMKSLSLLISLALLPSVLVSRAQASETAKLDFWYASATSFYSCDYAEAQTKSYLQKLGAHGVQVSCNGGLPDFDSLTVTAEFTPGSAGQWTAVQLESNESCDFNERLIRELLSKFTTRNVNVSSTCWDSQGRVSATLDVLE